MAKVAASSNAPSNLAEPLLPTGSADDPEAPPTKEELKEELEQGTMSWMDLIMFFANPEHWMVTMMVTYTAGMLLLFLQWELFHGPVWNNLVKVSLLLIAGLSGATYTAFLAEQLKEEVNKYRTLVKKLRSNKTRLEATCETMQDNVDTMQEEIENFKKLQKALQDQGDKIGGGLKDVLAKSKQVVGKLEQTYKDQMSTLLSDVAQSFELMDDTDGMSRDEFEKYKKRLPRDLFKDKEMAEKFDFDAMWDAGEQAKDEEDNKVLTMSDVMNCIDEASKHFHA